MLGAIRVVTITTPDLVAVEAAYVEGLDYRVLTRTHVSEAQARGWQAPAMAGCPALVLGPASGEAVYLRFVEDASAAGWRALRTFGWNVCEFIVQDVNALARRLAHSAFEIIGEPRPLTRFPMIRAMQAIGPGGECCYFTEVGPGSGLQLAAARSFVGRIFIVVLAGIDADTLGHPYARFGNRVDPPVATPVTVISKAHGLPPDTQHRHGLVRLTDGALIELDEYPATSAARPVSAGRLPPGMAVVSFDTDHLAAAALAADLPAGWQAAPCTAGAAGELIELLTHQV